MWLWWCYFGPQAADWSNNHNCIHETRNYQEQNSCLYTGSLNMNKTGMRAFLPKKWRCCFSVLVSPAKTKCCFPSAIILPVESWSTLSEFSMMTDNLGPNQLSFILYSLLRVGVVMKFPIYVEQGDVKQLVACHRWTTSYVVKLWNFITAAVVLLNLFAFN